MSRIIIGEAVALELAPAGAGSRVLGAVIDVIAYLLAFIALGFAAAALAEARYIDDGAAMNAVMLLIVISIVIIIPTTVETLSKGRSLGKLAMGLQIVCDDGSPIRFRHALVRALIGIVELWFTLGSLAIITSLFNERGKRIGDYMAGTYAIRVRVPPPPPPPMMPHGMERWANHADMRGLPDSLAMEVRLFIARIGTLAPQTRLALSVPLAAKVEKFVSPGPPVGTPPEIFLIAVMAERRARETASMFRTNDAIARESELARKLPFGIVDTWD